MKSVEMVMQRHVTAVSRSTKISTAYELMYNAKVSVAPVIEHGKLVGILTRELVSANSNRDKTVGEVMLKPDAFVEENRSIEDAAQVMVRNGMGRLPVVNSAKKMHIVGTVTSTAIVKELKK